MKCFKFSGSVQERRQRYVEGYFLQHEKDEIIGYMNSEHGEAFIKGLFTNGSQLIFVEITTQKKYVYGYAYKDIRKTGIFDEYDWLSGLFSGESEEIKTDIQVNEDKDLSDIAKEELEKRFQAFYENLDDWDNYLFNNIQKLREYLN